MGGSARHRAGFSAKGDAEGEALLAAPGFEPVEIVLVLDLPKSFTGGGGHLARALAVLELENDADALAAEVKVTSAWPLPISALEAKWAMTPSAPAHKALMKPWQ